MHSSDARTSLIYSFALVMAATLIGIASEDRRRHARPAPDLDRLASIARRAQITPCANPLIGAGLIGGLVADACSQRSSRLIARSAAAPAEPRRTGTQCAMVPSLAGPRGRRRISALGTTGARRLRRPIPRRRFADGRVRRGGAHGRRPPHDRVSSVGADAKMRAFYLGSRARWRAALRRSASTGPTSSAPACCSRPAGPPADQYEALRAVAEHVGKPATPRRRPGLSASLRLRANKSGAEPWRAALQIARPSSKSRAFP